VELYWAAINRDFKRSFSAQQKIHGYGFDKNPGVPNMNVNAHI
jgi:hypothetical protein